MYHSNCIVYYGRTDDIAVGNHTSTRTPDSRHYIVVQDWTRLISVDLLSLSNHSQLRKSQTSTKQS